MTINANRNCHEELLSHLIILLNNKEMSLIETSLHAAVTKKKTLSKNEQYLEPSINNVASYSIKGIIVPNFRFLIYMLFMNYLFMPPNDIVKKLEKLTYGNTLDSLAVTTWLNLNLREKIEKFY